MEPRTRAGFDRILMGGTPEQLDQAAMSLLRSGYPVAAQICVGKAGAMRRFDAERRAAMARQEQAATLHAAQEAQAQALADAATKMHALAAEKPESVQSAPEAATVGGKVPSPNLSHVAPPIVTATGEAPLLSVGRKPRTSRKVARKVAAEAPIEAALPEVQHINGRARAGH